MCPERQLISLYMDGELPSPWKEKLETHLESCPGCRAVISGYSRLRDNIGEPEQARIEAAAERVWNNIPKPAGQPVGNSVRNYQNQGRIWRRSITLPLPAAAAAAVLIAAIFLALIGVGRGNKTAANDTMAAIMPDYLQVDDQGIVPVQDMTEVLKYLSSQNYGDFMVIRLPESRRFSRIGEPALINASDYSRRTSSR